MVIDEATQATEPSSLVPLTKGAQYVVLAGDQKQLPPTVLSQAAANAGLSETLFERLIAIGFDYQLLDTQYRMHPEIMEFPSRSFYGGRLRCGVDVKDRPVPRGFPWPRAGVPMSFVSVEGTIPFLLNHLSRPPRPQCIISVYAYTSAQAAAAMSRQAVAAVTATRRRHKSLSTLRCSWLRVAMWSLWPC